MTSFLHHLFSLFKSNSKKPEEIAITVNLLGEDYTVKQSDIHPSKEDLEYLRKKANSNRSYERLIRHKKIWAVLNFVKSIEAIFDSQNFYDLDKALLSYRTSIERLNNSEFHPSEDDIICALRFCDIQYHQGKCNHLLTCNERYRISNWKFLDLDYDSILKNVSERFIKYWDEVLDSYKQKSAKMRRIEYLINHLNEIQERKGLSEFPNIEEYLNKIKTYYTEYGNEL